MSLKRPEWVDYVAALLDTPDGTASHEIGRRVWELSTSEEILDYLTTVMTENAVSTRAFEIAWDIWALLSRQVAA